FPLKPTPALPNMLGIRSYTKKGEGYAPISTPTPHPPRALPHRRQALPPPHLPRRSRIAIPSHLHLPRPPRQTRQPLPARLPPRHHGAPRPHPHRSPPPPPAPAPCLSHPFLHRFTPASTGHSEPQTGPI